MELYNIKVKNIDGSEQNLEEYRGKVLLIVNTATRCGLSSQYEGLEKLYAKYKEKGFEILNFPSNQFLKQAPEPNEEIAKICQLKYGTTFKTFAKIDVALLYVYLKEKGKEEIENREALSFKDRIVKLGTSILGSEIKWNFTKFLIDREGNVVRRFAPTVTPEDLEAELEKEILR